MSYQVLARKYRPQRFEEVVGQKHVTQTLQNALEQKRIHHAYLFTGARGIGKTTVARLLAKALNCEKEISREPCNQCVSCLEILEGRSLDVQEIDGASNTGVDDVRQIREQTKYLPARGRYKIYIIDEVHMLSTQAFNALLKTLEEPPPHVVFIFATTEAHKIPVTILSRCQRYDFKRIPTTALVASLQKIVTEEKIECGEEPLHFIAQEAEGSLRDAQSLLDQAIAFAGTKITLQDLQALLGFLDQNQFWTLLTALVQKNKTEALAQLDRFYQGGIDFNRLASELLFSLRNLFLTKSLGAVPDWLELSKEVGERLAALNTSLSLQECDQLFQLAYQGLEEVARSPYPKMVLEVLLVRMTLVSEIVAIDQVLERLERISEGGGSEPKANVGRGEPKLGSPLRVKESAESRGWADFGAWLKKQEPRMASIVEHGQLVRLEGKGVVLGFEKDSLYGEMLKEEERQKQFAALLTAFFNRPMTCRIEILETQPPAQSASNQQNERERKRAAIGHESVKEAVNILGAVVEEVRVK